VCKGEIKFDIPVSLPIASFKVIVTGPSDVTMVDDQRGGGKDQTVPFDWSKFPQTAGEEFHATKITIKYKSDSLDLKGEFTVDFTGYGVISGPVQRKMSRFKWMVQVRSELSILPGYRVLEGLKESGYRKGVFTTSALLRAGRCTIKLP
jgi:hypothetical protein